MSEALTYIYYIFDAFIDCIFDDLEIFPGVTIGWVLVSVILFSLLIRNVLNMPRGMGSFDKFREHKWEVNTGKGTQYVTKRRMR